MAPLMHRLIGPGLVARVLRTSAWTVIGFVAMQGVRFGSNLILTRLLFPEAFGMMALVTVFMVGLAMFSDMGVGPSILQHKRGDERDFLDTAWTIQVIRGGILWLATCALALPVAAFYGEPMLAQLIPVAGLALLIGGFDPTRVATANRHLQVGRVTVLDLISHLIGIGVMVALAFVYQSVWALPAGSVVGACVRLILLQRLLPGASNRLRWEREAARDLIRFGAWIFLSTASGFLIMQGDRAILGKYLTLEMLGIYNIGYFLASVPLLLGQAVVGRVLIPVYRDRPPGASVENFAKLRRLRAALTAGLLLPLALLALFGVPLVHVLYDPRYALGGPILVATTLVQIPIVITMTYDQAALAAGDSKRYFILSAMRALLQTTLFILGAEFGGLGGAMIGAGLSALLIYPMIVWLARLHGAWDPWHDLMFAGCGVAIAACAFYLNAGDLAALLALGTSAR